MATDYKAEMTRLGIPERMHDGMILWFNHGIKPGRFLTSILSNDLFGASMHSDDENRVILHKYVFFLSEHAPHDSFGSYDYIVKWQALHERKRAES